MVKKILGLLAIIFVIVVFTYKDLYTRVTVISTLFTGAEQYKNFSNFYNYIDSSTLSPSPDPINFTPSKSISLPISFDFSDAEIETQSFLERTDTSALLVLKDGKIQF